MVAAHAADRRFIPGANVRDFSSYKIIGKTTNTTVYIAESDPDLLIIIPKDGTVDSVQDARENAAFYHDYARTLGKPCGSLILMTNMLGQDAETRRVYAESDPRLFFAAALVVENALSRALGSFFIGLARPGLPTKLFNTIDNAIEWLKTMRPA
jgi:hypothetical protein